MKPSCGSRGRYVQHAQGLPARSTTTPTTNRSTTKTNYHGPDHMMVVAVVGKVMAATSLMATEMVTEMVGRH